MMEWVLDSGIHHYSSTSISMVIFSNKMTDANH